MKKYIVVAKFSFLAFILWMSNFTTNAYASNPLGIEFIPSKIHPTAGYTVKINQQDGSVYEGYLDYDLRYCSLQLTNCYHSSGVWGNYLVVNGEVSIDTSNLNLAEGFYLTRYRPNGTSVGWSNFDLLVLDTNLTLNNASLSNQKINVPPKGSYMIFEDSENNGYARIDIETDTCELGGITMRITKTNLDTYWNPGNPSALRWCVKNKAIPDMGTTLVALGGTIYSYGAMNGNGIKVTYPTGGTMDEDIATQGLLGSLGTISSIDVYNSDSDLKSHYSLLPKDRKIPNSLSTITPQKIVDLSFGHPIHYISNSILAVHPGLTKPEGFDSWHSEALAPIEEGNLRMRYVEVGTMLPYDAAPHNQWQITEDWEWQTNGLLNAITQWVNVPVLCWRGTYNCESGTKTVGMTLIASYIPDSSPLTISFDDSTIDNGDSYTLNVTTSGKPYHGFLQIKLDNGSQFLWRDVENKPIYVSNGKVIVPAIAYGNVEDIEITFQARPYLVNSSISSTSAQANPKANASNAPYSASATLIIGSP